MSTFSCPSFAAAEEPVPPDDVPEAALPELLHAARLNTIAAAIKMASTFLFIIFPLKKVSRICTDTKPKCKHLYKKM